MSDNRIIEGVGRKIVDALKQQSEVNIQNVIDNSVPEYSFDVNNVEYDNNYQDVQFRQENQFKPENQFTPENNEPQVNTFNNYTSPVTFTHQQQFKEVETFASDLDELDMPTNVAVLKHLIGQLPASVSKQTGAQIIKQTMEALGISMKSVLQEAQQVQENLNNKSRECLSSIVEYKKQINILERQSQKLQRQSASLNDIISLFVQTGI